MEKIQLALELSKFLRALNLENLNIEEIKEKMPYLKKDLEEAIKIANSSEYSEHPLPSQDPAEKKQA